MKSKETICAVVVTFNRKELLLKCLKAIIEQSHSVDALIIVDNFSSDGTAELLLEHGYINELPLKILSEPVEIKNNFEIKTSNNVMSDVVKQQEISGTKALKVFYIRMNENTGGAGGFHEGVRRGYEKGYDWLWLMDDDGRPDVRCLENLLKCKAGKNFLNPLVVNISDDKSLSFGLFCEKNKRNIKTINEAKECAENSIIENVANPFNGTFISKVLIEKIGLPKKEMFIWGDEVDYFKRALNSQLGVATVTIAIHKHPKGRVQLQKLIFNRVRVAYNENNLKDYCLFRNKAYIFKEYHPLFDFVKYYIKYLWFFIFTKKFNITSFLFFNKAIFDGIFENWGGEGKYLGK